MEGGGVGKGSRGAVRGKKKKKGRHRMTNSEKGCCSKVPVVSQPRVHELITDVAWGE